MYSVSSEGVMEQPTIFITHEKMQCAIQTTKFGFRDSTSKNYGIILTHQSHHHVTMVSEVKLRVGKSIKKTRAIFIFLKIIVSDVLLLLSPYMLKVNHG